MIRLGRLLFFGILLTAAGLSFAVMPPPPTNPEARKSKGWQFLQAHPGLFRPSRGLTRELARIRQNRRRRLPADHQRTSAEPQVRPPPMASNSTK